MSQYAFGSGMLWATPLTDASGNAIANPTPVMVGVMHDASVDFSFETKTLHGQNQFPVAAGRGKGKITGKAKFAQLFGAMFNNVVFGQTMTGGLIAAKYDTVGTAIATSVSVTAPNSGAWNRDFGVIDSVGRPMTRVASAPAAGQYAVAAGVYSFASADVGKMVYINYEYTVAAASAPNATQSTVMNMAMGAAPSFQADLYVPYDGKSMKLTLYKCLASKLGMSTKQDDFMIPEIDFECFANPQGQVFTWSLSE